MKKYAILLLTLLALTTCESDDPIQFKLSTQVNPPEGGTISPSSGTFDEGEEITLKATPSDEYVFKNWSDDASGNENPMTAVMTDDMFVTANFEKRTYPLTIEIQGEGTVKEEIVPGKSTTDYPSGTTVQLTAIPEEDWEFIRWQGSTSLEENPMVITITEPTTWTAIFQKVSYALTIEIEGEGTVKEEVIAAKSSTNYPSGTTVQLTAIPQAEWKFVGWSGDYQSTENPIELKMTEAINLTATFEKETPIPISFWNFGAGTVEAEWVGDPESENPIVRLTAQPIEGWYFVCWWGLPDHSAFGDLVTTKNPVEFDLHEALTVQDSERLLVSAMFMEGVTGKTYVPDDHFEQALIDLGYDDQLDDYVSTQTISRIEELDISNRNIRDLSGIEDFFSLQVLHCYQNSIETLNLSRNRFLNQLFAQDNELTDLDLSSLGFILFLDIRNNALDCVQVNEQHLDQLENPGLDIWQTDEGVEFSLDCGY